MIPANVAAAMMIDEIENEERDRELTRLLNIRRARIRRDSNPVLNLPDNLFRNLYRVSKDFILWLAERVEPYLVDDGRTSTIPTIVQVLTTVRFLAVGSYQASIGEGMDVGMAQPTVSRVLSEVTSAISQLEEEFIRFPITEEERQSISDGFQRMAQFPGIIGCIDGTHVPIKTPSQERWLFLNHNRLYTLNAQATCDHKMTITSLDIFAGAAHDSRIWRGCEVRAELAQVNEAGSGPYFLLGDQGYPLSRNILIPFAAPQPGSPEALFNQRHKHTRCLIERVFGVLKGKWRCLKKERTLHYEPAVAARFMKCCVILHNALIARGEPDFINEDVPERLNEGNNLIHEDPRNNQRELDQGRRLRNQIVENYP